MQKITGNNPNLDLLNINAYKNVVKFYPFVFKILSGNENITSIKGHNSVTNLRKMTGNNPKLDLVNINAHTKFGQILSIHSQNIERKGNSDISQGPQLYNKCAKNDVQESQPSSCQYQCIYVIW